MARLDRVRDNSNNVLPFKQKSQKLHWLTIVNTLLILGLYFILLGR